MRKIVMKYILYGSVEKSLLAVVQNLASALQVEFRKRASSYKGGVYYLASDGGSAKVIVQTNFVDDDGYFTEQDFKNYPTLIYFDEIGDESPIGIYGGLDLLRVGEVS
ncbi:hypothetical protein OG552_25085 [Streptomyces sp. NBC_01476]|uniref:hypothetical protein n=1 Tax=Streptomyces sp. NBC_01476 TaxID=2903881 RepID=UPI002E2FBF1F|nr:hypothetical protein [Streptomyces sp. NBC_01476]